MKKILIINLFIWIIFIFQNSLTPGNQSANMSNQIVEYISLILSKLNIGIDSVFLSVLIRKSAHIFEFIILTHLFYILFNENKFKNIYLYTIFCSFMVAICDETIQYFVEGRAALVTDVLIDGIGVALALAIIVVFKLVIKIKKKSKTYFFDYNY